MRILYLTLGLFVLLNIGAACRTPSAVADHCEQFASGLVRCDPAGGAGDVRG